MTPRPDHAFRFLRSVAALATVALLACVDAPATATSLSPAGAATAAQPTLESLLSGAADLSLTGSTTGVSLTTDREWSLSKTGSLSGNTVTWTITATQIATTGGLLLVEGQLTVTNTGNGPAPIGNIVVNLQMRVNNKWVTKSSNVANATHGDAATTANIHAAASSEGLGIFTENAASGSFNFMDATNNTAFSLTPQVMITAGETRSLLFSAVFNNNNNAALQLTPGMQIRAEVIVSFGNATQNGNSTANVDINGNGTIDADEGRIRSAPSRLTLTVPAPDNDNDTVTLTDTEGDISATGDVTFSNVVINLGATTGTVTANVSGGADGGSITNCAHLTDVDLLDCSTVQIPSEPSTCTPGAPGCGWDQGDMHTATQIDWGASTSAAGSLLSNNFAGQYGSALEIGGAHTITFTNAAAVFNYLPASGPANALSGSSQNPLTTSSGDLGGEVLGLQLNVDFSDADLLQSATPLGDLRFCNFGQLPPLNGQTVSDFLVIANHILGGGSAPFGAATAAAVAHLLNGAFVNGTPSSFAQSTLVAASNCPGS